MSLLPLAVEQELILRLAERRQAVVQKLREPAFTALESSDVAVVRLPRHSDAASSHPEERLRVLMVKVFPRFVRGQIDEAIVETALSLLTSIAEMARSDDFRYFDAFNNFWEHWPSNRAERYGREFFDLYCALLSHHLERLS